MAKTRFLHQQKPVVLLLLREIYTGFAGQTHKCTRDNVFLYLVSLLCSQTDFNFQIFNLPQLLLYFPHFPHEKLTIYLSLDPKFNPTKCSRNALLLNENSFGALAESRRGVTTRVAGC